MREQPVPEPAKTDKQARERRRHCRIPSSAAIDVSWTENGERKVVHSVCVDVSAGGMRLIAEAPIPPSAYVTFENEEAEFSGTARVQHTTQEPTPEDPRGSRYIVGLELSPETTRELFGFAEETENN